MIKETEFFIYNFMDETLRQKEQTAESLTEPSSSITCWINLIIGRFTTSCVICKQFFFLKKKVNLNMHMHVEEQGRLSIWRAEFTISLRGMNCLYQSESFLIAAFKLSCKASINCSRDRIAIASLASKGKPLCACLMADSTFIKTKILREI